jgi:hypothetical protein
VATFQWVQDIPAGILRNNALSNELVEAAIQMTQFYQFCIPVDDAYGANRGDTVSWPRASNIVQPTSIVLNEAEDMPEYVFPVTSRSATVQEIGGKTPITNLARQLTTFNLMETAQRRLRDTLSLGLDIMAATAFKDTQLKLAFTGLASNTLGTAGAFLSTSTANWNVYQVTRLADTLSDTYYAMPYDDDMYVAIIRTRGVRGIMDDPDWKDWTNFKDPNLRYFAERGGIDRMMIVETNHANALGNVGSSGVLGEGVAFGWDAVRVAEAMAPELRVGIPRGLGRFHEAGFYGMVVFRSNWGDRSNAGEANVVHIGSL